MRHATQKPTILYGELPKDKSWSLLSSGYTVCGRCHGIRLVQVHVASAVTLRQARGRENLLRPKRGSAGPGSGPRRVLRGVAAPDVWKGLISWCDMNLKDRFFNFCRQYAGAEEIDVIVKPADVPTGMKIADFLFQVRTIVCEVKTLTKETAEKLVAYMHANGIGPSELANGQYRIKDLFLKLDDGEKKYQKAITLITKPITDGVHEAEKQIRDTKTLFGIPKADGLLVILNDQVTLAGPPLIFERVGQRLGKRNEDGTLCYMNINHVLHVGERYTPGEENAHMNFVGANPLVPGQNGVAAFVEKFMSDWAAFNGQTFTIAGPEHEQLLKESELVINVGKKNDAT